MSLFSCGDNIGLSGDAGTNNKDSGNTIADGRTPDAVPTIPTVMSTIPASAATGVALNASVSATFSEPMDEATLTATTFTVKAGLVPVTGTVIYADSTAVFWPAVRLTSSTSYTATITVGAKSASNIPLAAPHTWTFTTGTTVAPEPPVNLRTAINFVILAKSGISTVPTSAVTGNLGVSPAAATYITGFSLIADATNVFSRSTQVTGKVYAANYAVPTPSNLTTAVSDLALAYTEAAGRAPDFIELGAGNIGTMTLAPGVYKWGTGLLIPTDIALDGSATDVWIFQVAQSLTISNGVNVALTGGAVSKNVFWQVAGSVDIGTTAHVEGVILTHTSLMMHTGSSINGRLMAQTAVTIAGATVVQPAP